MSAAAAGKPRLEIFQSLWAMELRHSERPERTPEDAFAMVAEAGYAGMAVDIGVTPDDMAKAQALTPLFARHKLACLVNVFPRTIEDLRPTLHLARELDARFVNVIGQVMPIAVADMIPVVQQWLAMAAAEQVPILFETHRNCITNDLFATLQLIDAVPEMMLCADLSHYLLDREFWYPISEESHALIRRVMARSNAFQGRVASREQIQVQISFPQHQKWFDLFAGWWEEGFRLWRARARSGQVLNFCCELGPKEYAITGPDGNELSDRWHEALMIRRRVEAIWARLDAEAAGG